MSEGRQGTRPGALRIAQITDTHLFAGADGTLLGLNTRRCLEQVIELALRSKRPDLVVATGDLTHDGTPAAYQQVRECFSHIDAPIYCLPGNHDEADALRNCMNSDCFHSIRSHQSGGWQMLFLDSTVAGEEGGHLERDELNALDEALGVSCDLPTLVWLHHQPVPVGSKWLDTMAVDNAESLFDILDRHPQVRAVIWGHVHQAYDQLRNGVRLLGSPSTCLQFLPGSEEFAVDPIPPGYRWLELYTDGDFDTGIERLEQIPGKIDLASRGY